MSQLPDDRKGDSCSYAPKGAGFIFQFAPMNFFRDITLECTALFRLTQFIFWYHLKHAKA